MRVLDLKKPISASDILDRAYYHSTVLHLFVGVF
jgi:hypothetical protein